MNRKRPPTEHPLALVLGLALVLAAGHPTHAASTDITVKGSDTLVVLMRRWAQAYASHHPGLNIQVTGGGTGTGIAALVNRTTDLCMASRPLRTDELEAAVKAFRRRPVGYEVALDAVAVFVHDTNPITALDLQDLARLFHGRIGNWRDLGGPNLPVVLYGRENSSGTYEFFKDQVLHGGDFAPSTQALPGTAAVLAAVTRDPGGIGYGGVGFAEGARALGVRSGKGTPAIAPGPAEVTSGLYPISRPLLLYVNPALDAGPPGEFASWTLTEAAQGMVHSVGCHPVSAGRRAPR